MFIVAYLHCLYKINVQRKKSTGAALESHGGALAWNNEWNHKNTKTHVVSGTLLKYSTKISQVF